MSAMRRLHPPSPTWTVAVAVLAGVFFATLGLWALLAPRSFYETVATWPPYNRHLLHDVGAFQVGLGSTLLLAVWRPHLTLAAALAGVGIGSLLHFASHVVDHGLGGQPSIDLPSLSILALVLLLAAVVSLTRSRVRPGGSKEREVDDLHEFAREVFRSQPFSQFIGAELTSSEPGKAELSIPIVHDLTQQHGFVHGGVISYLADNSITFAGGLALGGNALTSEFKINYLKPAVGSLLVARAHAEAIGERQAVCRCEVYSVDDGEEKLCAMAQGTVVPVTR